MRDERMADQGGGLMVEDADAEADVAAVAEQLMGMAARSDDDGLVDVVLQLGGRAILDRIVLDAMSSSSSRPHDAVCFYMTVFTAPGARRGAPDAAFPHFMDAVVAVLDAGMAYSRRLFAFMMLRPDIFSSVVAREWLTGDGGGMARLAPHVGACAVLEASVDVWKELASGEIDTQAAVDLATWMRQVAALSV